MLTDPFSNIFNENGFQIQDFGPLHPFTSSYVLTRGSDLELVLRTRSLVASSPIKQSFPLGTARESIATVQLRNSNNAVAIMQGVEPQRYTTQWNDSEPATDEESLVYEAVAHFQRDTSLACVIDWLANTNIDILGTDRFQQSYSDVLINDEILFHKSAALRGSTMCVNFLVNNFDITVVRPSQHTQAAIIYKGETSAVDRQKIRDGLSFAFGQHLIWLGSSSYNLDGTVMSHQAVSGYPISNRAIHHAGLPPSLITFADGLVDKQALVRLVSAFYNYYDQLQLPDIMWLYWHSVYAPFHTAPGQFGSAIEALQRVYLESSDRSTSTRLLARSIWSNFRSNIQTEIDSLSVDESVKRALGHKADTINQAPKNYTIERLFSQLNLSMSTVESDAWLQRNAASHGGILGDTDFIRLVRDTKLLRIRFNKLLLRMLDGSNNYFDFYTPGYRILSLEEAI